MKSYYQDDFCTIYHADCREILSSIEADVLVTDPPYGISHSPSDYWEEEGILGDDEIFDPGHLPLANGAVIFGANHFADQLPPSAGWIVWNKRDQVSRRLPGSDAELAWTNLLTQVRIFTHVWLPHTLRDEPGYHPTQKPTALMERILLEAGIAGVVCDPYMGSGSTLRAAKNLGLKAIGVEIEERYCEIAAQRLGQEVLAV